MRRSLAIWGVFGGLASAPPANAASLTASGLYGINQAGDVVVDGFGPGLALEGGLTLPGSLYVGASVQHFFGLEQEETLLSLPAIQVTRSASTTYLLGHVGYDFELAGVVLRPNLGVGYGLFDVEVQSTTETLETSFGTSEGGLVLSPAAQARIAIDGAVSGCVTARYDVLIVDGDDPSAIVIGAGVGLDF